jgi:hypothetical protein
MKMIKNNKGKDGRKCKKKKKYCSKSSERSMDEEN